MTASAIAGPSALKMGLAMGVAFAVLFGGGIALTQSDVAAGIFAGVLGGPLFGLAMGGFLGWMSRRMARNRPALAGENALLEGTANHVANAEARGGWLYLTDTALHFKAHKLNIQRGGLSIPLADIAEVVPARALGLFPTAIAVGTRQGKREKFVVQQRAAWIDAIRIAMQRLPSSDTASRPWEAPAR